MAKNELTVEVKAELTVSDDTAIACYRLLDIYCDNKLGDLSPGKDTCEQCALCNDGYCNKIKGPIY